MGEAGEMGERECRPADRCTRHLRKQVGKAGPGDRRLVEGQAGGVRRAACFAVKRKADRADSNCGVGGLTPVGCCDRAGHVIVQLTLEVRSEDILVHSSTNDHDKEVSQAF